MISCVKDHLYLSEVKKLLFNLVRLLVYIICVNL